VTSLPERVDVECPGCGHEYETWHRRSINLTIEPWAEEGIREATTARCPECGLEVELGTLLFGEREEAEVELATLLD
jgi:endogenous inhibitor of DNA gyrase (YacG/DUF329 family)